MNRIIGIVLLALFTVNTINANAQESNAGKVSLVGSAALPMSDFSSVTSAGLGGALQVLIPIPAVPELSVGGEIEYMKFLSKDLDFTGGPVKSPSLTIIPVLATVRYTFESESKVKAYVQTAVGLYHLRASNSFNSFGYAPGVGLFMPLSPDKSWFHVQASYHITSADYFVFSDFLDIAGGNVQYLNVVAGVAFAFGN